MSHEIMCVEARCPVRRSSLIVRSEKPLREKGKWSSERKSALIVSPMARPETEMPFVKKITSISSDETLDTWHKLKKVGLPVVPTMRKVHEYTVLMTNLTADGSQLFGKYLAYTDNPQVSKEMIKKFKKIKPIEIKRKVWEMTEICNQNNIELAFDDAFEVLVCPDGSWRLVILDLSAVDIYPNREKDNLEEVNSGNCTFILDALDDLRGSLR